jgi:hypothetical protein
MQMIEHITVKLSPESIQVLENLVKAIGTLQPTTDVKPAAKKSRASKKAKAEELEDMEELEEEIEEAEEDEEEIEEAEESIEDEESFEDDEPAKLDAKQLTQLKKALNSFAAKNGKPKAVKILQGFAKVSQDVKASDFAKIMKALKV